ISKWAALPDFEAEARALCGVAQLYMRSGDWGRARGSVDRALQASRSAKDSNAETEALLVLAAIHLNHGNDSLAKDAADKALALSRSNPNPQTEAEVSLLLGGIYYLEDITKGRNELERARNTFESIGDRIGVARSELYLAGIDSDLNHHK